MTLPPPVTSSSNTTHVLKADPIIGWHVVYCSDPEPCTDDPQEPCGYCEHVTFDEWPSVVLLGGQA